jgi:hypothetical protein
MILRNDEQERCITYTLTKANELETADQIAFASDEDGNRRFKMFDEVIDEGMVAERLWEIFRS